VQVSNLHVETSQVDEKTSSEYEQWFAPTCSFARNHEIVFFVTFVISWFKMDGNLLLQLQSVAFMEADRWPLILVCGWGLSSNCLQSRNLAVAVLILPYLEQEALFALWTTSGRVRNYNEATLPTQARTTPVAMYQCPSRQNPRQSSSGDADLPGQNGACGDYTVCVGSDPNTGYYELANGSFLPSTGPRLNFASIIDGLSNTIFVGEKHIRKGTETQGIDGHDEIRDSAIFNGNHPQNITSCAGVTNPLASSQYDVGNYQFGSAHSGVVIMLLGDGSVKGMAKSTNGNVLAAMATRAGGEVVPAN
jgi:hypothetical protein